MNNHLLRLAFALFLSSFAARGASAGRPLSAVGDLQATLDDGYQCSEQIAVTIEAPTASPFQGIDKTPQTLLDQVRSALELGCPQIREIAVVGRVAGAPAYRAHVSAESGWILSSWVEFAETSPSDVSPIPGESVAAAVMNVLKEADEKVTQAQQAGGEDQSEQIFGAALAQAERIASEGLAEYLGALKAFGADLDAADALRAQASDFADLAEVVAAFSGYQEAAEQRAHEIENQWCLGAFAKAGFPHDNAQVQVLGDEGAVSLAAFVCAAQANGYSITLKSAKNWSDPVTLAVADPSGEVTEVILYEQEAESGSKQLVGQRIGDSDADRAQWTAYVSRLMHPASANPGDGDALTDCDQHAADPEDPQRLADGVPPDALDLDSATEACKTALEASPDSPRLQYQLARLLSLAGDEDAALQLYEIASDAGYAMASYQLAEALFAGAEDNAEQRAAARDYYALAAEQGYAPAAELAAMLSDDGSSASAEDFLQGAAAESEDLSETSENYNFSVLISRIYRGAFKDIPDDKQTRSIVSSVMTAFNQNCGEPSADVGLALMNYGSDMMRALNRDQMKGLEMAAGQLLNMVRGFQSGGLRGGLEGAMPERPMIVKEGLEDGERFIQRYSCAGTEFTTLINNLERLILSRTDQDPAPDDALMFQSLMSSSLRKQQGIPDPGPALRERKLKAYANVANGSCMNKYADDTFCRCMAQELERLSIADGEWEDIGSDFGALVPLSTRYEGLPAGVASCVGSL